MTGVRGVRLACCMGVWLVSTLALPFVAGAQDQRHDRDVLLERIAQLEARVPESSAAGEASATTADGQGQGATSVQEVDLEALLARLEELERRLSQLESSAVLSEPETRVRRVEVWVDQNGIEHDTEVDGARRVVTYQRERVYRRQTISEKIEDALAAEELRSVELGVDAAMATQFSSRTAGADPLATGKAYALASTDLFFTARIAQYTLFFADVVALSGSAPDTEIPSLSLINGYTARLGRQNELLLREAWLRTEFFSQRLAISAGRLDLTNYFDRNQAANDETSQFLSDVLVNNPALGLSSNGAGVAAVFDPRMGFNVKLGFQQSNPDAANLSESIYSLVELGYVATPFPSGEGNYRLWFRSDNSTGEQATAVGLSLDQKMAPAATLFGRVGSAEAADGRDNFYSVGLGFQNGLVFNRWDTWGLGFAHTDLDFGDEEDVVEAYYSFGLSDRLRLSGHLQYFRVSPPAVALFGYLVPGVRFQASF